MSENSIGSDDYYNEMVIPAIELVTFLVVSADCTLLATASTLADILK